MEQGTRALAESSIRGSVLEQNAEFLTQDSQVSCACHTYGFSVRPGLFQVVGVASGYFIEWGGYQPLT